MQADQVIAAWKSDPGKLTADAAAIVAAQQQQSADTLTFQADTSELQTLLGTNPKLAEPGADGQSIDVYSLDANGNPFVENIPLASFVTVPAAAPVPVTSG
jgi:hypothetical protein